MSTAVVRTRLQSLALQLHRSAQITSPIKSRYFSAVSTLNMPAELKPEEVNSKTDPSVAKQYDDEAPIDVQWKELYEIIDKEKITMLGTYRKGVGPVSRAMALAKRDGPDILYLANKHSQKFQDLEANKEVNVSFQDSTGQGWVSITGEATTISNDDPRIKELYTPTISAWFGDLGDGVHDGTDKDPRMAIIAVSSKHINYWKKTVSSLGFMKEVGQAAFQGKVAQTGVQRQLTEADIKKERK